MKSDTHRESGAEPGATTDFNALLDAGTSACLAEIAQAANRLSIDAYLVGGMVRDMVSGKQTLATSPDVTIIGEASNFARTLATKIENCSLVSVSQHHTAEVKIGNTTVDIASARIDVYEPPGSLPQITLVDNLNADLSRRDYTLNAMALPIRLDGLGALIDPFDGRTDAQNGVLRIIREDSFNQDPLRMLRGIRLAARYKLDFEPQTAASITASLNELREMTLRSPQRVFNEFRLWFDPKERLAELISIADQTGILNALGLTRVNHTTTLQKLPRDTSETERFAAFAYRCEPEATLGLADRLKMPSESRTIVRHVNRTREIAKRCVSYLVRDLELRNALVDIRDDVLRAIIAVESDTNVAERFNDFRNRLRHVRPELNGNDLIDLGVPRGPLIGELLNELLELRIERSISTVREEKDHVIRRLSDG